MEAKKPVLVVDDERASLELICQVLDKLKFPILCADKPAQAFDLFDDGGPFLVLTDLSLGNHVDGVTMADRMHLKDPLCIFIAISGYLDMWGIGYLLGSVFTDIIQKPFSIKLIEQVVTYAWDKHQRWGALVNARTVS